MRWLAGTVALLAAGAGLIGSVMFIQAPPAAIAPALDVPAPPPRSENDPPPPGMPVARPVEVTPPRAPRRLRELPPIDQHDPWTGEDLAPELAVAAQQRPQLLVDRTDPWDSTVTDPAQPRPSDPVLDRAPWAITARGGVLAQAGPEVTPSAAALDRATHAVPTDSETPRAW